MPIAVGAEYYPFRPQDWSTQLVDNFPDLPSKIVLDSLTDMIDMNIEEDERASISIVPEFAAHWAGRSRD